MSSGACRALVASLIAVLAASLGALPVAARSGELREESLTIHNVQPARGYMDVSIVLTLENTGQEAAERVWGPVYLEDQAVPSFVPDGVRRTGNFTNQPGPWTPMVTRPPKIDPGQRI